MHSEKVVHKDIKPSNISISKDFKELKLLDFNTAQHFNPEKPIIGVTGEWEYQPPEMHG